MTKQQAIKRDRHTKIVATLGPASSSEEMIRALFVAGVDVFRMNFSHGTHEDHAARIDMIRRIEGEFHRSIAVLGDLQGPKLRVGTFKDGEIDLKAGMVIRFDQDNAPGDQSRVCLPHPEIHEALHKGDHLLMDDGKVKIEIVKKGKDYMDGKVIAGQKLSNHKGVNVPGVVLPIPALTTKDRKDLTAALKMGVDWVALSFVQKAEDVAEARKLVGTKAALMAKIEKPSALEHFDSILDIVDGIMIARGDLGVETPAEDVPAVQKRIVNRVREAGKPVIVATQMLESMIESPTPTRAEASDVATAVYDGTDAVMLSAETAAGQYPLEAVKMMDRICTSTETSPAYRRFIEADGLITHDNAADALTKAAYHVAKDIGAACIVNYTTSGSTARRTSRQRPSRPILCLTQNPEVARRLCLSYGVNALHVTDIKDTGEVVKHAAKFAKILNIAKKGDRMVVTAGVPFGTPGSTNILRVAWVD